jgi:DNA invertase Pin-like site-specific DNA recombinase
VNAKHTGRYVAYYRVSTGRQGKSGLGLEAQRQAVRDHLDGGSWKLIGEFTEVESGKRSDRPKLAEALTACRIQGAKLIIAKLDRLARNVAFISNLMESKVEFEAVDFPQANRLTIHIMAAIAEHEAKMISDRTRAALAAAKARGKRLGGFRGRAGTAADCAKARQAKSLAATARAADIAPVIDDIRTAGANSLRSIAKELNERGITAPRGGVWSGAQVRAVMARMPTRCYSLIEVFETGREGVGTQPHGIRGDPWLFPPRKICFGFIPLQPGHGQTIAKNCHD